MCMFYFRLNIYKSLLFTNTLSQKVQRKPILSFYIIFNYLFTCIPFLFSHNLSLFFPTFCPLIFILVRNIISNLQILEEH